MSLISLKNIEKSYGEGESRVDVIKGISLGSLSSPVNLYLVPSI